MKIAVLMTTFNRSNVTLQCLARLSEQKLPPSVDLKVFLADADSPDNTRRLVERRFPAVHCITIPRDQYWNQGMLAAYQAASQNYWDYYLLLNDDTILHDEAISNLIETLARQQAIGDNFPAVVGSVQDAQTGRATYGGMKRRSFLGRLMPGPFHRLVAPDGNPQLVDTCNANCLLIDSKIIQVVGFLDPLFTHGYGDTDLGYRMTKAGFPLVATGQFVGTCSHNPLSGSYRDPDLPFRIRIKAILGPKGLPPREWYTYCRRHAGILWPYHFLRPYGHAVIGGLRTSGLKQFRRLIAETQPS